MTRIRARLRVVLALAAGLAIAGGSAVRAQQTSQASPSELVRETVENEVTSTASGTRLMFRQDKETAHGSQTKLILETREGMAGLLVAIDGKPLNTQQRQAEQARVEGLASDPQELKKKQKTEKEDAERTLRIMKALPDAFLYEPDGSEPEKPGMGSPGEELVRLKFRPNPKYDPPTHTEQVLTGMQGYLLIDAKQRRIAKIDGRLVKEVGFGWGILGHLDKGGHFMVVQRDLGKGDWEITRMDLDFAGRALLFKKIGIKSTEVLSDFRPAPSNLTFAQAVEFLKEQEAELAGNQQQNGGDPQK